MSFWFVFANMMLLHACTKYALAPLFAFADQKTKKTRSVNKNQLAAVAAGLSEIRHTYICVSHSWQHSYGEICSCTIENGDGGDAAMLWPFLEILTAPITKRH